MLFGNKFHCSLCFAIFCIGIRRFFGSGIRIYHFSQLYLFTNRSIYLTGKDSPKIIIISCFIVQFFVHYTIFIEFPFSFALKKALPHHSETLSHQRQKNMSTLELGLKKPKKRPTKRALRFDIELKINDPKEYTTVDFPKLVQDMVSNMKSSKRDSLPVSFCNRFI